MRPKIFHLVFLIFSIVIVSPSCQTKEGAPVIYEGAKFKKTAISSNTKMILIPGGSYKPFYGSGTDSVKVEPFYIDERPVTNEEYLQFVKLNPQWKRSNILKLYADTNYLNAWQNDTSLPLNALPNAPITNISWYAAKAYAEAVNKRLPKLDEWEFVAMADEETANARSKKSYSDNIVDLYLVKNKNLQAVYTSKPNYWGVYHIFDRVWEWTDDFNSVLITNESRSGEYGDNNMFCAGSATNATDVLNYAAFMRFSMRAGLKAHYTVNNLGFRCAKNILKDTL